MKKRVICIIGVIVILLVACMPWVISVAISVRDYWAGIPLAETDYAGFEFYANAIDCLVNEDVLKNSVVIVISAIISGIAYVFLAVGAIRSVKGTVLKYILLFVFILPGIIPYRFYEVMWYRFYNLTTENREYITDSLDLIVGIIAAFRFSALFITVGTFLKKYGLGAAIKSTIMYAAACLLGTIIFDYTLCEGFSDILSIEPLNTLRSYTYYAGRGTGAYAEAAAYEVMQLVLSVFPAAVATVVLMWLFKKDSAVQCTKKVLPMSAGAIIPTVIFVMGLMIALSGEWNFNNTIIRASVNGIVYSLASTVAVTALAVLIVWLAYRAEGKGIAFVCILCILAESVIGKRMLIAGIVGMFDNIFAVVCNNLHMAAIAALVLLAVLWENEGRISKVVPMALVTGGIMFSKFWCNIYWDNLVLFEKVKKPVSMYIGSMLGDYSVTGEAAVSTVMYMLCPVVVVLVCIAVGAYVQERYEKVSKE